PGGVGLRWLGWSSRRGELVLENLRWFVPAALVTTFAYVAVATQDDEGLKETLSQVNSLFFMLAVTIFSYRTLIPEAATTTTRTWRDRVAAAAVRLWLLLPSVLVVLSLTGYVFTGERIVDEVERVLIVLLLGSLVCVGLRLGIDAWIEMSRAGTTTSALEAPTGVFSHSQAMESSDPLDDMYVRRTKRLATLGVGLLVALMVWTSSQNVVPGLSGLLEHPLWLRHAAPATSADARPNTVVVGDIVDAALVLLVVTLLVRHLAGPLHLFVYSRAPLDAGTRFAVTTVSTYILVLPAVCLAAHLVGLTWGSIQWLAAALSVGLGFGLQEILANFVSGLILLFDRSVRPGDYVTVGGVSGYVTKIRIRSTTIMGSDWKELIVPNKEFITTRIVNWSLSDPRVRVELPLTLAHGSDLERALSRLIDVARSHPQGGPLPAPSALVTELGGKSITIKLRFFVGKQSLQSQVTSDVIVAITRAFAGCGSTIAFS
ncbi:MAG: mechanosensitive ion channel, partial [Candidatus Riflebacteria bacterium]|nr:mechanosensitive ion channel [Candidatus Riflebacteria bacterium]